MNTKSLQPIKNLTIFLLAKIGFHAALMLPRFFGLWLFGLLGKAVFLFTSKEKTRTIKHLRLIYGKAWSEQRIMQTAGCVYRNLGKNLYDAVKLSRATPACFNRLVKHDDLADFKKAFEAKKGVIVITAHVGCFEILLHFFARHGFRSMTVGTPSFYPRLNGLIRSLRSGPDIDYMERSESPRKIIRWLSAGFAFGVLIDQDTRVEGVFAPFLGLPAYTPSAPIRMAMKLGVPVVVATTVRRPDDTHYCFISKPLDLADTGDFNKDLVTNVTLANDLICKTITAFPDQWVWMHRRWKTKPPAGQGQNAPGVL